MVVWILILDTLQASEEDVFVQVVVRFGRGLGEALRQVEEGRQPGQVVLVPRPFGRGGQGRLVATLGQDLAQEVGGEDGAERVVQRAQGPAAQIGVDAGDAAAMEFGCELGVAPVAVEDDAPVEINPALIGVQFGVKAFAGQLRRAVDVFQARDQLAEDDERGGVVGQGQALGEGFLA